MTFFPSCPNVLRDDQSATHQSDHGDIRRDVTDQRFCIPLEEIVVVKFLDHSHISHEVTELVKQSIAKRFVSLVNPALGVFRQDLFQRLSSELLHARVRSFDLPLGQ